MSYYKRIFAKPSEYKGVVFRSHLEKDFAIWLDKNLIEWEYEKHRYELLPREEYIDPIDNKKHIMRSITILPDFYLPEYNIAIECQGKQHYESKDCFGGEEEYIEIVERDLVKHNKCIENGISIIYYTNLKEGIVNKFLNETVFNKNDVLKLIKNLG